MDTEKMVKLQRAQLIFTVLIFLVVVAAAIVIFTKIQPLYDTVDLIKQEVQSIDMDAFNGAVKSLDGAAENFSKVDTETLNSMVQSISDVAGKLQSVTNALGRLFGN